MGNVAITIEMQQTNLRTEVNSVILRKAMDHQLVAVQQLLAVMPELAQNPSHLGNKIDLQG